MKLSDFHYDLPPELIARYPAEQRSASRLLCVDKAGMGLQHRSFSELTELLTEGDLLVFNDTRVIPARLHGHKETGGRVEVLIERMLDESSALAQIRASKSPKRGSRICLGEGAAFKVDGRQGDFYEIAATGPDSIPDLLQRFGHIPLPPYIDRDDEETDFERYQTVYASNPGAVAAPTAGLHFDDELLAKISGVGVDSAFVTLHVGAGTFAPVRVEQVETHRMHAEYLEVSLAVCEKVAQTKARGGRVIAVGTTSVRCLETAAAQSSNGQNLEPYTGETRLFIYPGYDFNCVDAMITNFHLPESTLLMLVSAFASQQGIQQAYREAVAEKYRFFSYGDAMFIG